MSVRRVPSGLLSVLAGLALAAAPVALDVGRLALGDVAAFAAKGGGGKGGHGGGRGNAGGKGAEAAAAGGGASSGKALGKSKAADAIAETAVAAQTTAGASKKDPLHPSNLGRLNGFMNASSTALANASPNSAIGIVAQEYRAALEAYLGGAATETTTEEGATEATAEVVTEETVDPALAAAAELLARAANKPLSPEIVAAINSKLAATEPTDTDPTTSTDPTATDPAVSTDPTATDPTASTDPTATDPTVATEPTVSGLAALADPTSPESLAVAAEIAAAAEAIQATETNQGLGPAPEEETTVAAEEPTDGTTVLDETTPVP